MKIYQQSIYVNSLEGFFRALENPPGSDLDHPFYQYKGEENKQKDILWFRGQEDYRWPLRPRLYRNIIKDDKFGGESIKEENFWCLVKKNEKLINDEFVVRNYHLLDSNQQNTTDKYFRYAFMQHFGFSTRLLDWTEQATPALYFALQNFFSDEKRAKRNLIPCVWLLRPFRLQKWSMNEYNHFFQKIYDLIDQITILSSVCTDKDIATQKSKKTRNPVQDEIPVPFRVPYNNERVRAQSGVFTIFPDHGTWCRKRDIRPSKLYLEGLPDSISFLFRIIIISPQKVCDELKQIGIKQSNYFPEVPVVSSEIEKSYLIRTN